MTFDADTQSFEEDVVIDAIFGIGLSREVEEPHKTAIDSINRSAGEIIAVDVPSGLSADTGEVFGSAVRADITYTIGFMKKGFDRSDGVKYTGKVNRVSIGYPKDSLLENVIRKEQKE